MRLAALVPTRGRPVTAVRAVGSFLEALDRVGMPDGVVVAIADDSDDPRAAVELDRLLEDVRARHPVASIVALPRPCVADQDRRGGPGAARNRALRFLRERSVPADVTVMFDDDVVFRDVDYRGRRLACDGVALLSSALLTCARPRTIIGCDYAGRQDLSILEHLRLDATANARWIEPAVDRGDTSCVAPAGISTAFLAIAGDARAVPDFPEHYNEDYVWLHALDRAGWRLERTGETLVHAPPGEVEFTVDALEFQIFGEIVWLTVLESDRFPVDQPEALAAAIEEIVNDAREASGSDKVRGAPELLQPIENAIRRYEGVARNITQGRPCAEGKALAAAISSGLDRGRPLFSKRSAS